MLYPTKPNASKTFEDRFKSNELKPVEVVPPLCKQCHETGFAWLMVESNDVKVSAWAYCNCKKGAIQFECKQYKLPKLDASMLSLFKIKEFPIQAFVPNAFTRDFEKALWLKVNLFKKNLKESEKFWNIEK